MSGKYDIFKPITSEEIVIFMIRDDYGQLAPPRTSLSKPKQALFVKVTVEFHSIRPIQFQNLHSKNMFLYCSGTSVVAINILI